MSIGTVEESTLWSKAFSEVPDAVNIHRRRLAESFWRVRERIQKLLSFIPRHMHGFTVHDISHLDALWEMGSLIAGKDTAINPAEAYVFGLSVLLHDAGMTVAAFPGGLDELKATREWQDSHAILSTALGVTEDIGALATVSSLRLIHARKAEELATQCWLLSGEKDQHFLIEDSELRHHYGELVGKIAHSHHWPAETLTERLPSIVGAHPRPIRRSVFVSSNGRRRSYTRP